MENTFKMQLQLLYKKLYFKIHLLDEYIYIYILVAAQGGWQGSSYQLHDKVMLEINHCRVEFEMRLNGVFLGCIFHDANMNLIYFYRLS